MTAARLRAAASRLRELAEAATPGDWRQGPFGVHAVPYAYASVRRDVAVVGGPDAAYIAAMHPGLALALAGWFDSMAEDQDAARRDVHRLIGVDVGEVELDAGAVAVIDAVLGDRESASR